MAINKKWFIFALSFAVMAVIVVMSAVYYQQNKRQKQSFTNTNQQIVLSKEMDKKGNNSQNSQQAMPDDLVPLMLNDAIKVYIDNSGYECFEAKDIVEPKLPAIINFNNISKEEIAAREQLYYSLLFKELRPKLTIQDYDYSYKTVDLDGDGIMEFIIEPNSLCASQKSSLRGASNNGAFLIYQKINGNWRNIGEINGNNYELLGNTVDNYRDLMALWHISATCYTETTYEWNKAKLTYEAIKSKDIGSCR